MFPVVYASKFHTKNLNAHTTFFFFFFFFWHLGYVIPIMLEKSKGDGKLAGAGGEEWVLNKGPGSWGSTRWALVWAFLLGSHSQRPDLLHVHHELGPDWHVQNGEEKGSLGQVGVISQGVSHVILPLPQKKTGAAPAPLWLCIWQWSSQLWAGSAAWLPPTPRHHQNLPSGEGRGPPRAARCWSGRAPAWAWGAMAAQSHFQFLSTI